MNRNPKTQTVEPIFLHTAEELYQAFFSKVAIGYISLGELCYPGPYQMILPQNPQAPRQLTPVLPHPQRFAALDPLIEEKLTLLPEAIKDE